ncbi:hypothetical protein [Kitasatospora sp. DSM 101779]|uniref:hypothetical protein n=1 Tax=Kitasatospora sp. DSM 101779 TaxID=2853165 RepID=UPI0021D8AF1B|nr:hypothetical protein [Kitasatospora sp. DSM 101779]MCU7827093.1 hypothetical protein [Kitasatospora sp. DSM 101779]
MKEWISSPPADNAQSEAVWNASRWGNHRSGRERAWGDYRGFVGGYLKDERVRSRTAELPFPATSVR